MKKLLLAAFAVVCAIAFGGGTAVADTVMHNCPSEGEWSIAVYTGKDGGSAGEALATCGVAVAYNFDESGAWERYIEGAPEVSNLDTLDNLDAVLVLGGNGAVAEVDEAVTEVIYGRQYSDALPTLENDINHGALTMYVVRPGGFSGGYGPYLPTTVESVGDGDVEATFEQREMSPAEEFLFYWEGELFATESGPRAIGLGFIYSVEVGIGADGTYTISIPVPEYQEWWCGPRIGVCRVTTADWLPFNPTCPISTWVKEMNEPLVCPGYPDAEFGLFRCKNPPAGKEYCSIFD